MDSFWLKNPTVLFDPKRLKYYMPGPHQTWQEQANSLMRFIIYLSLIMYVYKSNPLFLVVPPLMMAIIQYYLYQEGLLPQLLKQYFEAKENSDLKENYPVQITNPYFPNMNDPPQPLRVSKPSLQLEVPEPEFKAKEIDCKKPTVDNPFGNAMPYDPIEKQVLPVCPNEFEKDDKFYAKLFHGIDDLFERNNSQRQFTTNPASTRINDREAAIQFFYNTPYTEH